MTEFRRLFPYIRPNLHLLASSLLLLIASGALEMLIIMLLAPIFNQVSPATAGFGEDKFSFLGPILGLEGNSLARIGIFFVVFSFLKGIFLYFAEYWMGRTGQGVVAVLRKRLSRHLLDQSLSFYTRNPTGKLMARVITDTERLQETVSKTFTDFFRQSVLLLCFLGLVLYIDWVLALLSFLIAPIVLMITFSLGRRIRKVSGWSQESLSDLSHALQETMGGQRIVKAFGMENYEGRRLERSCNELMRVNLKATRITALSSPLVEFIGYVSFVPFLLYAHYQIVNRDVNLGDFVVFVAALLRLYEPVRKLSRMHLYFQQAFASSTRVFELLESTVEIQDSPAAKELDPFRREVAFQGVSFRYDRDNQPSILRDINLTIRKGEIVALVGSSGAGKSSLVSLIPRFYDVSAGQVAIDGIDVRKVTLHSLRRQIATVTQDTFLFNDTVRSNIAYGREDCTLEEVIEAARAAFIHDFVSTLPEGYETEIGERGQRLSGGEQQRVAIARAVMKNAPILILDEATSALDTESERLVQEALYNLMKYRTTLVIAHRLSTVRMADRIVVMEAGRIVEVGDHEALLEQSGVYRKLYDLQFVDPGVVVGTGH